MKNSTFMTYVFRPSVDFHKKIQRRVYIYINHKFIYIYIYMGIYVIYTNMYKYIFLFNFSSRSKNCYKNKLKVLNNDKNNPKLSYI